MALLFLLPLVLIILLFIFLPVMGTFINSLYRDVSYLPRSFVGLAHYQEIFSSPEFWQALGFTLSFVFAAVAGEMLFGLIFALLLNENFPGRGLLRALVLIPWAIPTIISAKTWKLIYDYSYGIINHLLQASALVETKINWFGSGISAFWAIVIADVWKTTPFVVIILLAGLQGISEDLYKQARIDGSRLWGRFIKITLPLLAPVLAVSLIFRTIDTMRVFDLIYVLTGGGPGGETKSLSFLGYEYFRNDTFGLGSSISVIMFFISLIFTLFYLKIGRFKRNFKD